MSFVVTCVDECIDGVITSPTDESLYWKTTGLTRISFTSPTSPTAQLYRPSRHFHSTAGVTKTRPSTSLTTEQRIRNRSTRIKGLPQWKADIPLNTPIEAIYFSKAKPSHPALLELFHQPSPLEPTVQIEQALKVYIDCRGTDKTLDSKDFMFVLQTIQDHASSQEQFWDSIATLIRSSSASQKLSVNIVEGMGHSPAVSWDAAIAGALSRVYWTQKQDVFIHQVQHAKIIDEKIEEEYHAQRMRGDLGSDQPQHFFPPFMATHQIMACTMVESLMLKFNAGYALELYGLMSELDIQMPGRVMAALLKIAVHSRNDYQLEKIGHLFVSECGRHSGNRHPPILTNAKLMDSFVYGACEHELYDLARDVFNKGLQAGGKYRAQTYTKILNSYSVKEFGFDIVIAGTIEQDRKHRMNRYKPHRNPESPTTATRRRRAITVAKPEDLEYYIQRMEQQAIEPTITTLNVLVKLYLEMAQYKVEDAPSWMAAFKRFNPQGLKPDVVTNNILLAHYERHRDLSTMLKIYNDLAGELEDSGAPDGLLKRNRRNNVSQIVEPATLDLMEDRGKRDQSRQEHQDNDPLTPLQQQQLSEQEKLHNLEETAARQQLARHRQKRARSSRDIYTYNTMIHALLQHAVESKDVAAIGQCFHDMEQDKIPADVVTYNTNILYHVANGDLGAAVQVFRCMNQTGDVPDPSLVDTSKPVKSLPSYAHYNHHIHRGHVTKESITAKGTDTAAECQEHPSTSAPPGIPAPDVVTMTTLIQGFGQAKDLQ
ncbi:hypothetical protein BG004_004699 [Podila humilis]|nr:hypothetical protein BG004_004699 [Podila humilis]